ncbi:MAG: FAD-dependent oxidoreductase [Pseudomonadota bacterium]
MPDHSKKNNEFRPPCSDACPAGTDVRGYIAAISEGRYEDAFEIIRTVNPFGSACGRICPHACEDNCRRKDVDEALSARALKRFVYETMREYRKTHRSVPDLPPGESGKRVAIVGAGPSGLTAARDLALRGHTVEVFDREEKAGGMMMNAIPRYRLPREALQEDIDAIFGLPIKLHTGKCLGKDFTIDDLQKTGFDAVIVAIGLQDSHTLPLPGMDAGNVLLALPFLRALARGDAPEIGKNVIVVGGGNVAIDVARSAKRLGAEKVTMVCLESMDIIPASPWEIEEAVEEGIDINPSWGPECVELEDGDVCGLTCKAVESVFDENGRFSPTFFDDRITRLEGDTIILAIGQRSDLSWTEGTDIDTQGFRLIVDPNTLATSVSGLFACGEVASGPGSAIQAVAHGQKAARIVNNYLKTGKVEPLQKKEGKVVGRLDDAHANRISKEDRQPIILMPPRERIKGFMDYEKAYTEEQAMIESRRCMNCGLGAGLIPDRYCSACLTCLRVCPFGVPEFRGRRVSFPEAFCVACGMCAVECPGAVINVGRFPEGRLAEEIQAVLKKSGDGMVRFACIRNVTSRKMLESKDTVYMDCLGRLSDLDMLNAFRFGASKLVVHVRKDHECTFDRGMERLLNRVESVNARLGVLGVENRVDIVDIEAK